MLQINADYSFVEMPGMKAYRYKCSADGKVLDEVRTIYCVSELVFYKILDEWNNPSRSMGVNWKYFSV